MKLIITLALAANASAVTDDFEGLKHFWNSTVGNTCSDCDNSCGCGTFRSDWAVEHNCCQLCCTKPNACPPGCMKHATQGGWGKGCIKSGQYAGFCCSPPTPNPTPAPTPKCTSSQQACGDGSQCCDKDIDNPGRNMCCAAPPGAYNCLPASPPHFAPYQNLECCQGGGYCSQGACCPAGFKCSGGTTDIYGVGQCCSQVQGSDKSTSFTGRWCFHGDEAQCCPDGRECCSSAGCCDDGEYCKLGHCISAQLACDTCSAAWTAMFDKLEDSLPSVCDVQKPFFIDTCETMCFTRGAEGDPCEPEFCDSFVEFWYESCKTAQGDPPTWDDVQEGALHAACPACAGSKVASPGVPAIAHNLTGDFSASLIESAFATQEQVSGGAAATGAVFSDASGNRTRRDYLFPGCNVTVVSKWLSGSPDHKWLLFSGSNCTGHNNGDCTKLVGQPHANSTLAPYWSWVDGAKLVGAQPQYDCVLWSSARFNASVCVSNSTGHSLPVFVSPGTFSVRPSSSNLTWQGKTVFTNVIVGRPDPTLFVIPQKCL